MKSRTAVLLIFLPALLPAALDAAPPSCRTWNVVAPADLDARLHRQIEELAAQDQALARFFSSAREFPRHGARPGGIAIELREEKSLTSFLDKLEKQATSATFPPTEDAAREGYLLEAFYPRASIPNRIRISAATPEGFHHALNRLPDLLRIWPKSLGEKIVPPAQSHRTLKNGAAIVLADYPGFPERGIVEGFYGTPWSHQDRLTLLRFEGRHGMNVYYYAPKDDPYHRKLWREPYPPADTARLRELVETAHRNFVDFCFAISPGLSMTYSSDADFVTLTHKLQSVGALGVSCFALFLDDVPQELQNPDDKARYPTMAAAHVDLINRLFRRLKSLSPANRLTVTPTTYTNAWGNRDYIKELGAGVDPGVAIVWTGPDVASPEITVPEAREWGEYLHRKPLVWDNFPVNDGRRWRVHLGPLRGRDAHLPEAIAGLFSNPMNQAVASMIPLETVADYLWNPAAYNPDKSEIHALASQYGKEATKFLSAYLETYSDYWWDENIFTPLFSERRYPFDLTPMRQRIAALEESLGPLENNPRFAKLVPELSPFPGRTRERLEQVKNDPAFRVLPDGKLQWREDDDALSAARLVQPPALDGDFAKWQSGALYVWNQDSQLLAGRMFWKGAQQFSLRAGLGWDEQYLYIGVDVTDDDLYQPFFGRGIENGDTFVLTLETAFRKDFLVTQANGNQYRLYFSPGNFSGVGSSIFSDEDYLPPRPRPHDCNKEIKTAWKKAATGFSGDIAIPVTFFDGGAFSKGYEIGIGLGAEKVIRPSGPVDVEDLQRIVYGSKADHLFRLNVGNPASYQRLVLEDRP